MLKAIIFFFLREKRNIFINKFVLPSRLFSSLLNILFYYYAANAFLPNKMIFEKDSTWSLFEFVMVGELVLFFVTDSLVIYTQQTRTIIQQNILDPLLNTRTPLYKSIILMGFSSYLLSSLTILFDIGILYFFFDFHYPILAVSKIIFLNISFLFIFIGIGMLASAFLILFKRGGTFLGSVVGTLSIASGAYFPIEAFPLWLKIILSYSNPLFILLSESRKILKGQTTEYTFPLICFVAIITGLILLLASFYAFNYSINRYKEKGQQIILGT